MSDFLIERRCTQMQQHFYVLAWSPSFRKYVKGGALAAGYSRQERPLLTQRVSD